MSVRALELSGAAAARWKVWLALLTVYVVWGSTYLGIKIALEGWPPFAMAALRFALAGVLMYGWLRWRGAPAPSRRQWRNAAITGTLLLAGGNGLVCFAELSVSSGMAAIAVASMPLFAALFAGIYGQWPARRDAIGLAIGFAGVLLLNAGGDLRTDPAGALALLLAPAAWAFGSVWSRRQDMPEPFMSTAAQMLCGSLALALIAVFAGESLPDAPSLRSTAAMLYLALFGSIAAFSAYIFLLHHVRPALSTSYAYVNPPIAVLFGMLLLGERLTTLEGLAMLVIITGVALILSRRS